MGLHWVTTHLLRPNLPSHYIFTFNLSFFLSHRFLYLSIFYFILSFPEMLVYISVRVAWARAGLLQCVSVYMYFIFILPSHVCSIYIYVFIRAITSSTYMQNQSKTFSYICLMSSPPLLRWRNMTILLFYLFLLL